MKLEYTKPTLYMESFSLTQSIAVNCGGTTNKDGNQAGRPTHHNFPACGWDDGYDVLFLTDQSVCTDQYDSVEDAGIDMCYDNPSGGIQIFSSY